VRGKNRREVLSEEASGEGLSLAASPETMNNEFQVRGTRQLAHGHADSR
jgi:hypothetical protein